MGSDPARSLLELALRFLDAAGEKKEGGQVGGGAERERIGGRGTPLQHDGFVPAKIVSRRACEAPRAQADHSDGGQPPWQNVDERLKRFPWP